MQGTIRLQYIHYLPAAVVAASNSTGVGTTLKEGNKVHAEHLGHHFRGRLELAGVTVGPVSVDIYTAGRRGWYARLFEDVLQRRRQRRHEWPGREFSKPYNGGMKAHVTDGRTRCVIFCVEVYNTINIIMFQYNQT